MEPGRSPDGRAQFVGADLRGARFFDVDLSGAVLRAVDVQGAEIDAPWLCEPGGSLTVNGVDVVAYVDAELNRRFPGRADRRAEDPATLRTAWESVERAWAAAVERAGQLPLGTVEVSVDGEWSFAQTLRHLVMATDTWLRGAVWRIDRPYHPIGQPNGAYAADGHDTSVFSVETPPFEQVLEVRADRVGMVRDFLVAVTPEELSETRPNPWSPAHAETVLSCVHTILEEEWEHLRYALRDLEAIERRTT